jgi:protein SCO1/2
LKTLFFITLLFILCGALPASAAKIDFEPQLGTELSTDLVFHEGREVHLGDFFGRAPIVLELGYLQCLNLCSPTRVGVAEALDATGLQPERDYVALFVSIDPRDETAPLERRAGWHFLTGARSAAIVAEKVGFRYSYEAESGQFAHPAGFVVLDDLGRVAAYFPGVRFDPQKLRDALLAARDGRTPGIVDRVLFVCFHDPVTGRYSKAVLDGLRAAGIVFLAGIGLLAWRRL